MLLSEREERERRFKLALRAGLPIILLIGLVLYATLFSNEPLHLTVGNGILMGALVFTTVYFIYFFMEITIDESLIDPTTQSFNYHAFLRRLEKHPPKTLILFIIKNLQTINEHYSTQEVDRMLYILIHRLHSAFKKHGLPKATIARHYGAEFLISVDKHHPDISAILETFIEENATINEIEIDYAFAVVTDIQHNIKNEIVRLKDLIRMQTRQTSRPYDIQIKDAKELSEIEHKVIDALDHRRIELQFRPILNVNTSQYDIYEVNARLHTPGNDPILPKIYLPIVNRLGLGREYDMLLVTHLLEFLPLVDNNISFSFNLSPFSLRNEAFTEEFFKTLEETRIEPSRLIIELYERKTHHNLAHYLQTLHNYRQKGVRIAIDNFGSSNASMEYMKHFKFDFVQFDREYVASIDEPHSAAMLQSLIRMAKELEIRTIAKWVDKPSQKQRLIAMGIDYLQGFGIAYPLKEDELIAHYNTDTEENNL